MTVKGKQKAVMILLFVFLFLILTVLFRLFLISSAKLTCSHIAESICEGQGAWQDYITYSMLSDDIKSVVSKEEFESESDDIILKMYYKLENTCFNAKENFPGSTTHWRSQPLSSIIIFENKRYTIDYDIDFDVNIWALYPKPEVVNFTCYIKEESD